MTRILLVEDDENLAYMLAENLELEGFSIHHVTEADIVLRTLEEEEFDLILMDIDLSQDINGFDLAEEIRQIYPTLPIIFTTGKTHFKDVERGLSIRYVDYQKKPYGTKELLARINNILNRLNQKNSKRFLFGQLSFNPIEQVIIKDDLELRLTKTEATFLRLLCENMNNVITKESIVKELWGSEDIYQKEHSMNNLTHKIRKYLEYDPSVELITISKVGYKLTEK